MAVTQQSCELSSAAADSISRPTSRLSFVTDIQQMMYACFCECAKYSQHIMIHWVTDLNIACMKEGLTICGCIALNLHISCFEPSCADKNWFKVSCSEYGDETVSDSVQHQDHDASWSLFEWIPLQLLQHGWHPRCPSVITTGETCSIPLNRVDFVYVVFDAVVPYWWCVLQLRSHKCFLTSLMDWAAWEVSSDEVEGLRCFLCDINVLVPCEFGADVDTKVLGRSDSLEGSAVEVVLCIYWSSLPCKGDHLTVGRVELHQPVFFPFLETVKVGLECVGVMHCFDDTIQQAVISKHPNCGTNSTGEVIDVNKK